MLCTRCKDVPQNVSRATIHKMYLVRRMRSIGAPVVRRMPTGIGAPIARRMRSIGAPQNALFPHHGLPCHIERLLAVERLQIHADHAIHALVRLLRRRYRYGTHLKRFLRAIPHGHG